MGYRSQSAALAAERRSVRRRGQEESLEWAIDIAAASVAYGNLLVWPVYRLLRPQERKRRTLLNKLAKS